MDRPNTTNRVFLAGICLICLGVGLYMAVAIRALPWAYSDSVGYLVAARSLAHGAGLTIPSPSGQLMPLTLQPPLYPLLITPIYLFGYPVFESIRVLNVILLLASLVFWGIGLEKMFHSKALGLLFALNLGVSISLVRDFNGAMTEPVFIFLTLLDLLLLVRYLSQGGRATFWLLVTVSALLPLLRYIGVVSVGLGVLGILALGRGSLRLRLRQAALFGGVAGLPVVAWLISIAGQSGSLAARQLQMDTPLGGLVKSILWVFVGWAPFPADQNRLSANPLFFVLIGLISLAVLVFGFQLVRRRRHPDRDEPANRLILLAIGYTGGYLLFLVLTSFTTVPPDINDRMLSPLQPLLFLVGIGSFAQLIRLIRWPAVLSHLPVLLGLLWLVPFLPQMQAYASYRNQVENTYSSPGWDQSPTLRAAAALSPETPLISNEAAPILLYTNRFPYELDLLKNPYHPPVPLPFGAGDTPEETAFRNQTAALILFKNFDNQLIIHLGDPGYGLSDQLLEGLTLACDYTDGAIYFYRPIQLRCPEPGLVSGRTNP